MILSIAEMLDVTALAEVNQGLMSVRWVDGASTAGATARRVKQNQQADLTSRVGVKLRDQLSAVIQKHPVLTAAAQPARFSKMIISRTENRGRYGLHIDNPFMGDGDAMLRTDLSYTLFLSAPDSYEGGALTVEQAGNRQSFKPEAGTLILYPSTSLHEVEPVTSGTRIVCVGWIESRVKSASRREILFDLENLAVSLSSKIDVQSIESLTLSKVIANLKRDFS